jgi:pimeloyl-ACP methyl ester carboxylesterase
MPRFEAGSGSLKPSSPEYKDFSKALPSDTPAAFRRTWASVPHRRLGAMPLVVLSAEYSFSIDTPAGVRFWQAYQKGWYERHEALAHLSSRGMHRIIKGSGHAIQVDKPQAVIDAVNEVLRELRIGAKS